MRSSRRCRGKGWSFEFRQAGFDFWPHVTEHIPAVPSPSLVVLQVEANCYRCTQSKEQSSDPVLNHQVNTYNWPQGAAFHEIWSWWWQAVQTSPWNFQEYYGNKDHPKKTNRGCLFRACYSEPPPVFGGDSKADRKVGKLYTEKRTSSAAFWLDLDGMEKLGSGAFYSLWNIFGFLLLILSWKQG